MEPLPFPCHPACPGAPWDRSEAERRDLRFRGPFVEMFFDRSSYAFLDPWNAARVRMEDPFAIGCVPKRSFGRRVSRRG
jgi:hypothetical protein